VNRRSTNWLPRARFLAAGLEEIQKLILESKKIGKKQIEPIKEERILAERGQ